MIFGGVCVICDDFVITTMRSSSSISSAGRQFVAIICKGSGPTKTTTPGHRRWPLKGNQVLKVINRHPMLYPMMQPPIFRNVGSCGMSNVLGLIIGFWHKYSTFASIFDGTHWRRRRQKNLDRMSCILYFRFLHV
jgi:hypothetical protein